jgi:predicted PhzF superfamily epimerase YddE/YHI9
VIVTAKGDTSDFVSRFFAPDFGVPEDPVTGSAHCTLIPYWAEKLGKNELFARQVSARGGELFCELRGDRVTMAGDAVLYMRGEIYVEAGTEKSVSA